MFKIIYEWGQSFWAITDPFLYQVFFLSVLILMVLPDFKVGSRFWVSGSLAVLVVEGLGCGLTEGRLVQIGWLNNFWAGDNPFLGGREFKDRVDK